MIYECIVVLCVCRYRRRCNQRLLICSIQPSVDGSFCVGCVSGISCYCSPNRIDKIEKNTQIWKINMSNENAFILIFVFFISTHTLLNQLSACVLPKHIAYSSCHVCWWKYERIDSMERVHGVKTIDKKLCRNAKRGRKCMSKTHMRALSMFFFFFIIFIINGRRLHRIEKKAEQIRRLFDGFIAINAMFIECDLSMKLPARQVEYIYIHNAYNAAVDRRLTVWCVHFVYLKRPANWMFDWKIQIHILHIQPLWKSWPCAVIFLVYTPSSSVPLLLILYYSEWVQA